jgi:hypothetical protein
MPARGAVAISEKTEEIPSLQLFEQGMVRRGPASLSLNQAEPVMTIPGGDEYAVPGSSITMLAMPPPSKLTLGGTV